VRRFWRGDAGVAPDLATRLSGSQDLFGAPGRSPHHSINFVTSHDGFTLADLTSYADKHNGANGEQNADGERHNFSSNADVEGPTSDPAALAARATRQRSLIATLALSLGVPMISGGDELGRTQLGNNNAYCQDGPLSWTPWPGDTTLATFVARAFAIRRAHPALRRERFLADADVTWMNHQGAPLTEREWQSLTLQIFGIRLKGEDAAPLLIYVNAGVVATPCVLPNDVAWNRVLDSSAPDPDIDLVTSPLIVAKGSLVVLSGPAR
jgi:isoamylase